MPEEAGFRRIGLCHLVRAGWILAFVSALWVLPAAAQTEPFADGLEAFDAGDYATTHRLWRPLAEQGHTDAQVGLAGMYENGLGVGQDQAAAARWYGRAARQGDVIAQLALAGRYEIGLGIKHDRATAYAWYAIAAAKEHPYAIKQTARLRVQMSSDEKDLAAIRQAELEKTISSKRRDKSSQ